MTNQQTVRDSNKPERRNGEKLYSFPKWLVATSVIFRWGLAVMLAVLLVGRYQDLREEQGQAPVYESQRAGLEQTQQKLQKEWEQFSDPAWRENYWKWRTMRHEPGEYYIKFYDGGAM